MLCYKVVCILKWVLEKNFGVPGPSSGWPVFNCVRLRIITYMKRGQNCRGAVAVPDHLEINAVRRVSGGTSLEMSSVG
jgi:hypothetical protein